MKTEFIIAVLAFSVFSPALAQMDHSGHDMGAMSGMSREEHQKMMAKQQQMGKNQVMVSEEKQGMIGLKSEIARVRPLDKTIRTVGIVAYDPELYAAQTEYAEALAAKEKTGETEFSESAGQMLEATRLKLRRLGLSDEQIGQIEAGEDTLIVGSPAGQVWIYGRIYEGDIPLVRRGMMAHVTSKNLPGKMFMGRIQSIDTVVDAATRSLKVRVQVKNEKGWLKPNMYVDLSIVSPLGGKLAIPDEAVLDTGEKQIVFVDLGKGRFEKREVVAGQRTDGLVEIVKGLKPGEKVVTAGTFLIDSESKLKATGGGHAH